MPWATYGCSLGQHDRGHLRLQALLDGGVSVWEADSMGGTAVHAAARSGHEECFRLLWQLQHPYGPPTEARLLTAYRVLLTTAKSGLLTAPCLLRTAHCLPPTTYYSLLTTYYLLLEVHLLRDLRGTG